MNKDVREVEVEVLPKNDHRSGHRQSPAQLNDDPLVAFVARLMDSVFTVPGTRIRFGLDPIIGLLPGLGDTVSGLISLALIAQSARHGVPNIILARMAANAFLNSALGSVPVVGDIFSAYFKSNVKNYDLLRKHAGTRKTSTAKDWIFVVGLLLGLILLMVLIIAGAWTLLSKLLGSL
jgi:hypothetical protein